MRARSSEYIASEIFEIFWDLKTYLPISCHIQKYPRISLRPVPGGVLPRLSRTLPATAVAGSSTNHPRRVWPVLGDPCGGVCGPGKVMSGTESIAGEIFEIFWNLKTYLHISCHIRKYPKISLRPVPGGVLFFIQDILRYLTFHSIYSINQKFK